MSMSAAYVVSRLFKGNATKKQLGNYILTQIAIFINIAK